MATRDSRSKACGEDGCERPVRARGMCSKHWRRWSRAAGNEKPSEWTPERRAMWKAREEAKRTRGGAVEPIAYAEIFDRDGWICQLCEAPVDPSLIYPDPLSKSLDHIVPLSLGGSHIRGNVQLAHLRCNLSKGNRVAA